MEFKSKPEAFQRWVVVTAISITLKKKSHRTQRHFHLEVITGLGLTMNSI